MKTVAIIQARMTSTRLPGKVMMTIGGKPMLWYVLNRTRWAKSLSDVIIATSTDKSDDAIVEFCKKHKISYFRGSLEDVLSRYYHAAKKAGADIIVRVTADCPLVDGHLIDKGIELFNKTNADYLSNTIRRTFPRGFDFEILRFEILEKAYLMAKSRADREHVTGFVWRNENGQFKIKNLKSKMNKSKWRLTVDVAEDFKLVKILIEKYRASDKNYYLIVKILDSHPEIMAINAHIEQKKYWQLK